MRPISAKQVTQWLAAVRDKLLQSYSGKVADKDTIRQIGADLFMTAQPCVKPTPETSYAVVSSLEHLIGKQLTDRLLISNATRVLANWHIIRDGMSIPVWDGSKITSDVVFLGVARTVIEPGRKPDYLVLIKLKTGLGAGIIYCSRVFDNAIANFLEHVAGVSKFNCANEEIAGMQARLDVSIFNSDQLRIHEYSCTADQQKHNKDLANRRADIGKCPLAPMPCNVCSKNIKECPLAVWLPHKEA